MGVRLIKCFVAFWLCVFATSSGAALWTITYPRPIDEGDARAEYPIALLKLALDKTGVNYELRPSDRILLTAKAMRQLKENREVNVVWSMTDSQREKELMPIRVPIAKGLIGLRLFAINEEKAERFRRVSSIGDLLKLTPLQGEEWPDTKILQASGFNVLTVPTYAQAYTLLLQGKGDFFPRSLIEIEAEMEDQARAAVLRIEPRMALYYPTAMYYFVSNSNQTLANLIETGLQRAIDDGSFDALFTSTFEKVFDELNIRQREVYTLDNPLLPPKTPLADDRLWYRAGGKSASQ
jgi:hypothetical protein